MAIGINVTKGVHDEGESKFFGSPAVPADWVDEFDENVIFMCQINLNDIAELDKDNVLPHNGYMYIFLDTVDYPYQPIVRFSEAEPDTVIDDFNDIDDEFAPLTEGWKMTFSEVADDSEGIRLFGAPKGWAYEEKPPKLLMQYDPLSTEMPFLDSVDGYAYLFYDGGLDDVSLYLDRT